MCLTFTTCTRTLCSATYPASAVTNDNIALVSTIKSSTTTDTERCEVADINDKAHNHVIHGKFVPPQVQVAHPESNATQQIEALVTDFAGVFPDTLALGLPPSRKGDHTIDLELGARTPAHSVYRNLTQRKTN